LSVGKETDAWGEEPEKRGRCVWPKGGGKRKGGGKKGFHFPFEGGSRRPPRKEGERPPLFGQTSSTVPPEKEGKKRWPCKFVNGKERGGRGGFSGVNVRVKLFGKKKKKGRRSESHVLGKKGKKRKGA